MTAGAPWGALSPRRARIEVAAFAAFAAVHLPGAVVALGRPEPVALVSVLVSLLLWSGLGAMAARGLRRARPVPRTLLSVALAADVVVLTVSGLSPPRPGNITAAAIGVLAICAAAALLLPPRLVPLVAVTAGLGQARLLRAADVAAGPARLLADTATVVAASAATCAVIAWLERERRSALAAVARAAATDPLTGLLNRRGLDGAFPALVAPERRPLPGRSRHPRADTGRGVGVVLVDVDHFKGVNDRRGHDVGDAVLVAVAEALREGSGPHDLLVRLGGEELAWFGTWPDEAAAAAAAEALRRRISRTTALAGEAVTVSAGVALLHPSPGAALDAPALPPLLLRADRALYRAKDAGRDRVEVAPPDALPPQVAPQDAPRGAARPRAAIGEG